MNFDSALDSCLVTSLLDVISDVISGAVVQSRCGTWSGIDQFQGEYFQLLVIFHVRHRSQSFTCKNVAFSVPGT